MPPAKAKSMTLPDGRQAYGIEVEFEAVRENWNLYETSDGTRLRIKTNLIRAFRLVDEQGNQLYDANNEPEYFVNTGMLFVATEEKGDA